MKDVKSDQPNAGQLVLTCIKLKKDSYQWRTLRYHKAENVFKCPYTHTTCYPTHWQSLPNF